MVQWLGLCAFTAADLGSIPGWGTKIPHTTCSQKPKKKKKKDVLKFLFVNTFKLVKKKVPRTVHELLQGLH